MRHPSLTLLFDAGARAAFQMLAGTAGLGSPPERQALFPRYARYYVALARLPRRARRALQRRWRRSLAAIALLLTLGQAPALAATLTVAPGAAPDIVPDGSCSLIEAIENANVDARTHADCLSGSGADTIVLPAASTQTLTQVHNSTYGATGLPVIGSAVTIDGNGSTIKRNSTAPQFRILAVNFPGNLTVKESTVSGGNTADSGGGILGGALTLMNSTVSGNTAGSGGGIYGGAPTLMNSIVSGNYARLDGGGVSNRGTATLTKSTVSGNSAGGRGGGLFNDDNGTLTLTNSTISGNSTSSNGGGVFNDSYLGPQRRFYGTVTLTNSTVYGNSAAGGGGGLHNLARLFLTNSTVSGNMTAGNGGGVDTPYGTITLTNSTVTGNRSGGTGGGVHMDSQSLYESSILTLDRTLVSGNTAPAGPEISNTPGAYGSATVIANNFNLLGHSGFSNAQVFSGFTPGATDLTPTSDGAAPKALDTILDTALADNGGATKTHALVLGSPAIDAVETGCPPPATDQRGISRPQALACDIGAFEGAIPRTADLAIGLSDAPDPVPVDGQLLYTFTAERRPGGGHGRTGQR